MARGITQSDVDRAADTLLAQGERPTVERIRQFLGTGSPNTVTRLLDLWWKALGGRLATSAAKVALPDAPPAVVTLASQLWEQALAAAQEHAEAGLEGERSALAAAGLEADARVAAAHQAAEASEARAAEAAAALLTANLFFVSITVQFYSSANLIVIAIITGMTLYLGAFRISRHSF